MTDYSGKKMIFFDLDGTLAESKSAIDTEMADLLHKLLIEHKVCIISGGRWKQFEVQVIQKLTLTSQELSHLFISTGGGSSMYRFEENEVHEMYSHTFTNEEKQKIFDAFDYALPLSEYQEPEKMYGKLIEDRGSQITFSALGQEAPLSEKSTWDPDHKKREKIVSFLKEKIPEFEINIGGTTSIDITQLGIDKAYGIKQASDRLGIPISNMLYIGDALFPGGNDAPARKSGIECVQVANIAETKRVIRDIIHEIT